MSKDTPAHVGKGDGPHTATNGAPRPGSPVAQALRDLAPPRHGRTFWTDLDTRLADEPQLRLSPRSAIRPITQPPPVIDDRNLAGSLKGDGTPPPRSSRRTIVAVAVAVLVLFLGIAALQEPDDDVTTTDSTPETTDAATPTSDGAAPEETAPPATPPPGTIDAAAPLTPGGVGPLAIGARLADLQAAGVDVRVDTSTFEGTGGTCYDAKVTGSLDLLLRFRAPDGQRRAEDPVEGVLTSVSIESGLPTSRGTDTGIALGAPQDQLVAAYGANLEDRSHPFIAGGHIFRADAGNGTGVAFFTDGLGVNRISVGEMDSIRFLNQCG